MGGGARPPEARLQRGVGPRSSIAPVKYGIVLVALLAGCSHSAWQLSGGQPPPVNSTVHVHGGNAFAAVLTVGIVAAGAYEVTRNGIPAYSGQTSRPPDMAPDRKVSEQDCSKPIDYTPGNIRCK